MHKLAALRRRHATLSRSHHDTRRRRRRTWRDQGVSPAEVERRLAALALEQEWRRALVVRHHRLRPETIALAAEALAAAGRKPPTDANRRLIRI